MIIVDLSAVLYQSLFSACKYSTDESGKPIKKVKGKYKTEDYKRLFLHKLINSLRYIYKDNKNKYGTMILAIDNHKASNWKKDVYPEYKANRKKGRDESTVNFDEFFAVVNDTLEEMKNSFPFIHVDVKKAEADDVIGVLAETYAPYEDILVVTHDKDMLQLLKYDSVQIYNPIKYKKVPKMSKKELLEWEVKHIFLGDAADNIPKIIECTEYSKKFISFLQKNDIYENRVHEFSKMSISDKLINEFIEENSSDEIYKPVRFGPVALEKFMKDYDTNMKSNPLYQKHYDRNKELVMFEGIPDYLRKDIVQCYTEQEVNINIAKIASFFMSNQLMELYNSYQDFLLPVSSSSSSSSGSSKSSISKPNTSSNVSGGSSEKSKDEVLISSLDEW